MTARARSIDRAGHPPEVSVIVPVRDGRGTVEQAVESVLAQRDVDIEVIVVDDGSTDGSGTVVEDLGDSRVRVLRQPAVGVSAARNAGIAVASGRYVAFLDADDRAEPHWLATLTRLAAAWGAPVVCCATKPADHRNDDAGPVGIRRPAPHALSPWRSLFLAGSFLVERELLVTAGGYDEQLAYGENTELGLRLQEACAALNRPVRWTDEPLVVLDRTTSGRSKIKQLASIEALLAKHAATIRRDRSRHGRLLGIAAVEASRHRQHGYAVRLAARSLRRTPRKRSAWARLAVTAVPPLARRRWGTYELELTAPSRKSDG